MLSDNLSMEPFNLSSFIAPATRWVWSSPGAELGAPQDVVTTFSTSLTLPAATSADLHVVTPGVCDVLLGDGAPYTYAGSLQVRRCVARVHA